MEPMELWMPKAFACGVVHFINSMPNTSCAFETMNEDEREAAVAKAREVIGFSGGGIHKIIADNNAARAVVDKWQAKYGSSFPVRLKTTYYYEMRDDRMLSEREFRVLLGLYSVIGAKSFTKIGWPMIQARAAGFMSPAQLNRKQGPVYSRGQIERACAKLLDRKFVTSLTYNRGERFWTNRMTPEELSSAIIAKKTALIKARQARAELSLRTTDVIKQTLPKCSSPAHDGYLASTSRADIKHMGGHRSEHVSEHVTRNTGVEAPQ